MTTYYLDALEWEEPMKTIGRGCETETERQREQLFKVLFSIEEATLALIFRQFFRHILTFAWIFNPLF